MRSSARWTCCPRASCRYPEISLLLKRTPEQGCERTLVQVRSAMTARDDAQGFTFPRLNSVNRVLRELKKEENSLFNCVCSVSSDAAFIEELSSLHPGIPIEANLRCGLWYVRDRQQTCYFKSTDGHNGNWSFSKTRLNIHLAETAANHGGCIVVDATRRGKSFPVRPPPMIPYLIVP